MSERELRLEPSVALVVAGKRLTPRQLEVLKAVYEEGSQNKAAQRLGISTPVLHRYLAQIEGKIGAPLTSAGPTGTRLNQEGERIALEHIALSRRMDRGRGTVVGGTVVSEELLLSALTNADPEGSVDLIISDDERNLQDFQAGLMDLVMLDEPSLGLAPLLVREIFDIILKINAEGKTVLLVEQNALAALSIAHYAYVLEVGRVVAEAPGQELLKDPKVKEAYLGG